ncbi:helix-turn-helix transcriptional regulator, partial [Bacillus atrophaeus ATCC 9372]
MIPTGSSHRDTYRSVSLQGGRDDALPTTARGQRKEAPVTVAATPKTGSPRDARPAAQRVLDAAKELFYRQGIRATGVEEVCRVAGTTKMSLYRAFPSKDALVEAILREDCAEEEHWYGPVLCASMPARDRPMAFLRQAAKAMRSPGF